MDTRTLATDISGLIPIIILILFLVIPYVLKSLGRHASAGRGPQTHEEPDSHGEPPLYEEHPGPSMGHDYDRFDSGAQSSKPITPKWF